MFPPVLISSDETVRNRSAYSISYTAALSWASRSPLYEACRSLPSRRSISCPSPARTSRLWLRPEQQWQQVVVSRRCWSRRDRKGPRVHRRCDEGELHASKLRDRRLCRRSGHRSSELRWYGRHERLAWWTPHYQRC